MLLSEMVEGVVQERRRSRGVRKALDVDPLIGAHHCAYDTGQRVNRPTGVGASR